MEEESSSNYHVVETYKLPGHKSLLRGLVQ